MSSYNSEYEGIVVSSYLVRKVGIGQSETLAFVGDLTQSERGEINENLPTSNWVVRGATVPQDPQFETVENALDHLKSETELSQAVIDDLRTHVPSP